MTPTCKKCHCPFPEDQPNGPCPACLFDMAIGSKADDFLEEISAAFPEFDSVECVGRGGMAHVFKVHNPSLGRFEALKVVRRSDVDAESLQRFESEARKLSHLGGSHAFVAVHATGQREGFNYIQMEYMEGGDLGAAVESGMISPDAALRLLPAIFAALQYAHDKRIIHRDVKPANILLNADHTLAKLGDFGIAKGLNSGTPRLTYNGQFLGTEGYVAPEVLANSGSASHLSDIFAVGQLLKYILIAAGKQKIVLPVGLPAVADKATSHDPRQRFQSVKALAREFAKQVNGDSHLRKRPILLVLAVCATGLLSYGGYRWLDDSDVQSQAGSEIRTFKSPGATELPPVVVEGPPETITLVDTITDKATSETEKQAQDINAQIRARMRDYDSKLEGDYLELLAEWVKIFEAKQISLVPGASKKIVSGANQIRISRKIDATQLKSDKEFRSLIRQEINEVLDEKALRSELAAWASSVEEKTRTRLIRCFQQVVAEDLGRSFDENLRGMVVKAVREIPVDQLIAGNSVSRIESAILASMPESAISEASRKLIKTAAVQLTEAVASAVAVANGGEQFSTMVGQGVGLVADPMIENALQSLNEAMTATPDPQAVQKSMTLALVDWNQTNIEPRLKSILSDYRRANIRFLEDKARVISMSLP